MKSTLNILALEDMEEDLALINYTLKKAGMQFEVKQVDTREGFIEALQSYPADVILSDHSLPRFNSVEALQLYKANGIKVPFILVTGAVSEEFAVSCLKQGADDYVLKSNLARLPSAINNALRQRQAENARVTAAEALQVQNAELKKINKELDSFVYSVSHNLRAPLMSVLGLLDLARHEDHSIALDQYFQMMESSIHKLDETVKEILDYSRNARQNLTIERIDLDGMVREHFEKMKFMAGSNVIFQEIHVSENAPFFSDRYRLSVIFNNLISNAIKYYDPAKEKPLITVSATVGPEEARLEVKDNGIGIDERHLSKVFDMFFRGTEANKGAGLGLYIVREAVEKLKGTIELESARGEGTTFRLKVPNFAAMGAGKSNDTLEMASALHDDIRRGTDS